jgi:hypothetical protein
MDFRTQKTSEKYQKFLKKRSVGDACRFCEETLPEGKYFFRYWKVLHNNFPYDLIAEKHDILVPIRHFETEDEMTSEEREELTNIKTQILPQWEEYHSAMENFVTARTMDHYHIHLLKFKEL